MRTCVGWARSKIDDVRVLPPRDWNDVDVSADDARCRSTVRVDRCHRSVAGLVKAALHDTERILASM